jgi:hypothetical protein
LDSRTRDTGIRDRVLDYLGRELPIDILSGPKPVAILANYVARGTREDRLFAGQAEADGLVPYWATYLDDAYTTTNPQKVDTIRPPILWPKSQRTRGWVVKPEDRNGPIGNLNTIFAMTSSEYQSSLREIRLAKDERTDLLDNTFDMSEWYRVQAKRFGHREGERLAPYYVAARFALITLCAYYHNYDGTDTRFMREVFYPNYYKVKRELGLKPVIVNMPYLPGLNETDLSFLDNDQAEKVKELGYMPAQSDTVGNDE